MMGLRNPGRPFDPYNPAPHRSAMAKPSSAAAASGGGRGPAHHHRTRLLLLLPLAVAACASTAGFLLRGAMLDPCDVDARRGSARRRRPSRPPAPAPSQGTPSSSWGPSSCCSSPTSSPSPVRSSSVLQYILLRNLAICSCYLLRMRCLQDRYMDFISSSKQTDRKVKFLLPVLSTNSWSLKRKKRKTGNSDYHRSQIKLSYASLCLSCL